MVELGNVSKRKVVINLAVMGGRFKDRGRGFDGTDIEAVAKTVKRRSLVPEKMGRRSRGQVVGWVQVRGANPFPLTSAKRMRASLHQA